MFRLTLKEIAAKKLRLVTTAIAVMLGVAFMAGTLVFSATIGNTFDGLMKDAYAGTDAVVRGTSEIDAAIGASNPRIESSLVQTIAGIDGVQAAEGHVSGYAQLIDSAGVPVGDPGGGAPTLGQQWIETPALNPFHLVEGHAPAAHGEIVIDRHSANDASMAIGDTVTVMTKAGPGQFTVAGIATFADADSAGGASAVLFTPMDAQTYVAEPGMVDSILVVADAGISEEELVARIDSKLPSGTEALTGAEITTESQKDIADDLAFIDSFLLVFAGIALFVGAFIIFNTFTIIIAQRKRETALLRAIGASRRQVVRAVLVESVVVGLIASLAGVALGIGIAKLLQVLLAGFGLALPAGGLVVETSTFVISMIVGTAVTVLAAFLPARKAGKVPPVAAMRDVAVDSTGTSRRRLVVGITITVLGVTALLGGLASGGLPLVGLGALVTFLGVAALAPVMSRPAARVLGWPAAQATTMSGDLARNNAMRNPRRTASTAAALMIGVGLVGFIAIFAASSKASVNVAIDKQYNGDFVLDTGSFGFGGVNHDLVTELSANPQFSAVSSTRPWASEIDGTATNLFSWDAATVSTLFDIGLEQGDPAHLGSDGIAVEHDYALAHGYTLGSPVDVAFVQGNVSLTVEAIYDDSLWVGELFVDHSVLDALGADPLDMAIYVKAADGMSLPDARAELERISNAYPTITVMDRDEFKADRAGEIDLILNLIYALLGLAIIIALLGITNTLALSIFERTRELGLLRAVGMTRGQLKATVRFEAVIIAVFGTLLGLAIGAFFGWSIVHALAAEGIGELTIPVATLLVVTTIAAVAGVAASLLPARRAARLDVLKAISSQ